jgi:hypothetical protein
MPGKRKAKGKTHVSKVKKHHASKISGGFSTTHDRALAGQEDAEYTTMVYETTSAFTSTAGATSYLQVKGNSIYHPYPGVSSSVAGYARMYTQYALAMVVSSTCEVMLWGGVSGQDEPFRIIIVPCSAATYSVYSAYSNISSLAGVPHAKQAIFSPGGKLPRISAKGTAATVLYGESKGNESAELSAGAPVYAASVGIDPNQLWYYLIGYQNFAGTTTTNQQAQVKITFKVKWTRPVATAEQALTTDFFGNEFIDEKVISRLRLRASD